jgi:hypothetical protein
MMQYKISATSNVWSPMGGPLIKFGKLILMDHHQSCLLESQALFHISQFWGHDALGYMEKEKIISGGLSRYVEF